MKIKQTIKKIEEEIDRNINNGQVAGLTAFERKEIAELKSKLSGMQIAIQNELEFLENMDLDRLFYGISKYKPITIRLEQRISDCKNALAKIRKTGNFPYPHIRNVGIGGEKWYEKENKKKRIWEFNQLYKP